MRVITMRKLLDLTGFVEMKKEYDIFINYYRSKLGACYWGQALNPISAGFKTFCWFFPWGGVQTEL